MLCSVSFFSKMFQKPKTAVFVLTLQYIHMHPTVGCYVIAATREKYASKTHLSRTVENEQSQAYFEWALIELPLLWCCYFAHQ